MPETRQATRIDVHDENCECDFCTMPLQDFAVKHGLNCKRCNHLHSGPTLACEEGCPCAWKPDWWRDANG